MRSSIPRNRGPAVKRIPTERLNHEMKQRRKDRIMELERECIVECVKEKLKKMKSADENTQRLVDIQHVLGISTISLSYLPESMDAEVRNGSQSPGASLFETSNRRILGASSGESTEHTKKDDSLSDSQSYKSSRVHIGSNGYLQSGCTKGKYYEEISTSEEDGLTESHHLSSIRSNLKHSFYMDQPMSDDLLVEQSTPNEHFGRKKSLSIIKARRYIDFNSKTDKEIKSHWPGRRTKKMSKNDNISLVRRFSNWMATSQMTSLTFDSSALKDLFKSLIGYSPAVSSIMTSIREEVCVPNDVPSCSAEHQERACLYNQIIYDQMNYTRKKKGIFFLHKNPSFRKKPHRSPFNFWFGSTVIPSDLLDTSALLKQLLVENPTVAEHFTSWIIEKPGVRVPKYLVKSGLLGNIKTRINNSDTFSSKIRSRKDRGTRRRIVSRVLKEDKLFFHCIPRLSEILEQTLEKV